jgi:signal peptidase I
MDEAPAPAKKFDLHPAALAAALLPPVIFSGVYILGVVAAFWTSMPGLQLWFIPWAVIGGVTVMFRFRPVPTLLLSLLVGVGAFVLAIAVNFNAVRVEGSSMEPTFHAGDVLLIDLTVEPGLPGGVYVLNVEGEEHNPLIKRLVGLPGETIDVRYGRVFSDDREVYPRDGTPSDTWNKNRPAQARYYSGGKTLGNNEYFFLGDNPPDSRDSRHFGVVKEDAIEGRAVWSLRGSLGFGPID